MKFHGAFYKKFGDIDTPEMLKLSAEKVGIELTDEEAESLFQQIRLQDRSGEFADAAEDVKLAELNVSGKKELADEELDNVAGGCGGSSLNTNELNGKRVTILRSGAKGTVIGGRIITICSENTVEYHIRLDNGQETWKTRQYFHVD